jgi:hypothetical protein
MKNFQKDPKSKPSGGGNLTVARYKEMINGNDRVEFFDLRFGLLAMRRPFLYGVDFDQEGNVVFQGFLSKSFGE